MHGLVIAIGALVFIVLILVVYLLIAAFIGLFQSIRKSVRDRRPPQAADAQLEQKSPLVLDKGVFGVPLNSTPDSVLDWGKANNLVILGSQRVLTDHEFKRAVGLVDHSSNNHTSNAKEFREHENKIVCVLKPSEQSHKFIDNHLERLEISFLKENDQVLSFSSRANFRTPEQFDLISDTLSKKYGKPSILAVGSHDLQIMSARESLSQYLFDNVGIYNHAGCTLISWNSAIVIYAMPHELTFIDGKLKFTGNHFSVLYFYYPLTEKIKKLKETAHNGFEQKDGRGSVEREKHKKESAMDNF